MIYPGKLTVADLFRIGCIGRLYPDHMRGALGGDPRYPRRDGRDVAEAGAGGVKLSPLIPA